MDRTYGITVPILFSVALWVIGGTLIMWAIW